MRSKITRIYTHVINHAKTMSPQILKQAWNMHPKKPKPVISCFMFHVHPKKYTAHTTQHSTHDRRNLQNRSKSEQSIRKNNMPFMPFEEFTTQQRRWYTRCKDQDKECQIFNSCPVREVTIFYRYRFRVRNFKQIILKCPLWRKSFP